MKFFLLQDTKKTSAICNLKNKSYYIQCVTKRQKSCTAGIDSASVD